MGHIHAAVVLGEAAGQRHTVALGDVLRRCVRVADDRNRIDPRGVEHVEGVVAASARGFCGIAATPVLSLEQIADLQHRFTQIDVLPAQPALPDHLAGLLEYDRP